MFIGRRHIGMTLIEVLTVVALIFVLTGLVMVAVNFGRERAEKQALRGTMDMLELAVEEYKDFWGEYPEAIGVYDNGDNFGVIDNFEYVYAKLDKVAGSREVFSRIDEKYKQERLNSSSNRVMVLVDPWGQVIYYKYLKYDASGKPVDSYPKIRSAGPDGDFGTTDDIFNNK